ncbi:c-di-GMP-binding flagellar brake protein YcgR [Neobacillus niacini]|uniref:PilZ domain-containing protein n=1 Tax=Neobacillus niacini TaxID=86668 RepID=UPI00285E198A|nr:PilZ domain-containing protein [Neobacillus niacini]MDR7080079.1 c-di-GMP-binding flagellar brake protein YcgR [Neobacillus niacini]
MEEIQVIKLAAVVFIILVSSIIYFTQTNSKKRQRTTTKEVKPPNRRDNFRFRINIKNTVMEVLKIGSLNVNEYIDCEIVDVSVGGVGILSDYDFPLREKVYVRVHFYLDHEEFLLNGRIVRKVENIKKRAVIYGIQFIDLSAIDENRLMKTIFAMENERRKIAIK